MTSRGRSASGYVIASILALFAPGCSDDGGTTSETTDSGLADSTSTDSTTVDTATEDTTTEDTTTEDSAIVDSVVADSAADTAVADTGTDTAVADTGTAETSTSKTATVWVMQLGDGSTVTSGTSVPLALQPITITYGVSAPSCTVGTKIDLASTGTSAVSLPISSSIGGLARSPDGKLVSFAGYSAAAGTAAIADSDPATVKRMAVAVNSAGTLKTMLLGAAANASANSIRGAVTLDGNAFWTSAEDKGITYTSAAETTTAIVAANLRWPQVVGDQLYVTTGSATGTPGRGVLTVGTGKPTTTATLAQLPGTGTSGTGNASPYGMLALDTDSTAGIDTLYLCDDRSTANGGGLQRWKLESATWVLKTTLTGDFSGCKGLTGWVDGTNVYLVATIVETTTAVARAVLLVDTVAGATGLTATTLASAPTNAAYRGVALAPIP